MNGNDNQALLDLAGQTANSIADVVKILRAMDNALPSTDGLKWFVKIYIMVTAGVKDNPALTAFLDPAWMTRLDVVFANFYFSALAAFLKGSPVPSSWQALFEARNRSGIDRIQFALAGMNAHINHDLALALLQTDQERHINPNAHSPQHKDFESVNGIIETVLPASLQVLASDELGELAQDTGKIGKLLAIWSVSAARDSAWDFADHLRNLNGIGRQIALNVQDKITGALGRSLLLPIA
ncbi:MAG TPA: DUF5995 family protein [Candidatus Angelobacter sp.]|jgi:hypothetical protein